MPESTSEENEPDAAILIVRAEGDGMAVARELANRRPGPGIDLRLGGEPVLPSVLLANARAIASEQAARNLDSRRRREDELLSRLEAARRAHQEAKEKVGTQSATHLLLLQQATWCEERAETAASLSAALLEAEADLDAAREVFAEAEAKVSSVYEQQTAVEAVIEEAQRKLVELDIGGQSENDVRRSLESANQAAREADTAAEAARARAREMADALADAKDRLQSLDAERTMLLRSTEVDPAPVIEALQAAEDPPLAPPDDATLNLAAELERRLGDLDALGPPPVPPTAEDIAAAEAAVAALRGKLEELRRPAGPSVPDWWDELAALHAEVVDAEAAAGSKRARASSRKRLEDALAAERELLDRLGYPSHLDALLSGGRPVGTNNDPDAIPNTQEALASAEARLHALYDAEAFAGKHRRIKADILRSRALGAALLGLTPSEIDPERLRRPRPDLTVTDRLAQALGAAGIEVGPTPLTHQARAWLTARDTASQRLPAVEVERLRALEAAAELAPQVQAAEATAEERESGARAARRQVDVLEAEMVNRMRPATDPATRAATAAAIRDHIGALEARITTARAEAAGGLDAASSALASATARFDEARRDTDDLSRRAGIAARMLPNPPENSDELLSDLGGLADALRAEYKSVDESLGGVAAAVAAAANAEADLSAGLAELRARDAEDPEPIDFADALRTLLDPLTRSSDVVLDPVTGLGTVAGDLVLDTLADLARQRPVVVVDTTDDVAAWALDRYPALVTVVSEAEASARPTRSR